MVQIVISRIFLFFFFAALQALVFNHIHLFGYATPMPYVYFLLILPSATPRWAYVAIGFLLGLLMDLFTNTPGMAAASLCAAALLTPPLLRMFSPSDEDEETFLPSARTMEWARFLQFAFAVILIHCLLYFTIEAFTFFDLKRLLLDIAGSTLLTFCFVAAFELLRSGRK